MKVPYSWLAEWVQVPWQAARARRAPHHGGLRARGARAPRRRHSPGGRGGDPQRRASPAGGEAAGVPRVDGQRRAAADRVRRVQRARRAEERARAGRARSCRASCAIRRRSCAASNRRACWLGEGAGARGRLERDSRAAARMRRSGWSCASTSISMRRCSKSTSRPTAAMPCRSSASRAKWRR